MKKIGNPTIKRAFALSLLLVITGCFDLGVQGGDVPEKFSGIDAAVAISPTTVKLSWTLNKKYLKYLVYQDTSNTSIKSETFQNTTVSGLVPQSTYRFSVTGVDSTGKEDGVGGFTSVSTLPTFTGISSTISLAGPTTVNLQWSEQSALVTYNIYAKIEGGTWDFTTPLASVTGASKFQAIGLNEGTLYCFYIVASYQDGTAEPAATVALANSSSACISTTSDLVGVPTVTMNSVIPGTFPWFEAVGGQGDMTTDIYDALSNVRVATRVGSGPFRSFASQVPGPRQYYALVSEQQGAVLKKAKIGLSIKDPTGKALTGSNVRALQAAYAVTPRLVSGGNGVQRLGAQIVKGDFNCDGIPDLAIAAPKSTPYVHPKHVSEMGSVMVYYGESYIPAGTTNVLYRLRTSQVPTTSAVAPNPQLIYYPTNTSGFHLGTQMAVGNFNGDCKKLNPAQPSNSQVGTCESLFAQYSDTNNPTRADDMPLIYRCDDLAIAIDPTSSVSSTTNGGGIYVVYGDPNNGLVSGSGATNYGINESTCDPVSGTCRAGQFSHNLTTVLHFGRELAAGDFNNDGFDDLAVSSTTFTTPNYYGRVSVMRGSPSGILPLTSPYANAEIQEEAAAVYGTVGATAVVPMATAGEGLATSTSNFGWALAGVPRSRKCVNITTAPTTIPYRLTTFTVDNGFDFAKCADLVIGDPSRSSRRGSVVSCTAGLSATAAQDYMTQRKITSWHCVEHWPTTLENGAQFGFSLLGVDNQNGYPYTQIPAGTQADITGALFVGAPWASAPDTATAGSTGLNAGKVFGYYATPGMETLNGIQGVLGVGGHAVQTNMGVPCNAHNNNVGGNHCSNQVIYDVAPEGGEHFGYALGTAAQNIIDAPQLPALLVSAPNRTVPGPNGSIANAGAVYVYKGDLSVLGANAQTRIDGTAGSPYFSGGINPFGPSQLYNQNVTAGAGFGIGGAVGDNFMGAISPAEVDVAVGAPDDATPYEANGSVSIFQSNAGFPATQTTPDLPLLTNLSKEINYRFEQAKVVGDVNGDGYADVVARIKIGTSRAETVIFYGSASGLIISPSPSTAPQGLEPKIIFSGLDPLLGTRFFPIGDVNGDGLMDVLFIGGSASYIYYGSLTGLVSNTEPSVSPVGKNPLKFGLANTSSDAFTLDVTMGTTTQTPPTYDVSNQAVAFGDFNGDGYGDFAVGLNIAKALPTGVDVTNLGNPFSAAKQGRVLIFYGSPNGPQVGTGGFTRRIVNGTSTAIADVVAKAPCSPNPQNLTLQVCYVQMVGSSGAAPAAFGWALATVKSMEPSNPSDGLVIGDPSANSNAGEAYYLRGGINGIDPTAANLQHLTSPNPAGGNQFGYLISRVGDIDGDGHDDLAISSPLVMTTGNMSGVYVFYGSNQSGTGQFFGASTISATPPVQNAVHASLTSPGPQWIVPPDLANDANAQFGYGMAAAGDLNGDGYADLVINVPRGDYELDVLNPEAGYLIVYFGSRSGLRSNAPISVNPKCYGYGTADETCEPYQIYLPSNQAYENTYLSNAASGDINGDGLPDLVMGALGRNSTATSGTPPTPLAFSVGIFYVLY